jgi:hypothetical protein
MLPLIDTVIGFAAIMLVLSLLVKTLTSLVKNHVDFYSTNLKHEVDRLAQAVLGRSWDEAVTALARNPATQRDAHWFRGIIWERLGYEFLNRPNMEWVLTKLGAAPGALDHLEDRLQVHVANISYAFNTRMKNLALVIGLFLCLALDVNAVTIWQTLYSDQQLRTTFATTYAKAALQATAAAEGQPSASAGPGKVTDSAGNSGSGLGQETQEFMKQLVDFQKNVSFGVGRVWMKPPPAQTALQSWRFMATEFFGSLLTGVLISIGAAYWHDLLRSLASLRQPSA